MNLTLSLLAGLLLLLPGIGAVAAWNHGGEAARRQELQLTSLTALFAVLALSLISHLVSYGAILVLREALVQVGEILSRSYGPVFDDPYVAAFQFALPRTPSGPAGAEPAAALASLAAFLVVVLLQSAFIFSLVRNPGLDVVFEQFDLRGQGWAFQRIVRPGRHGFVPYARVFTNLTSGDLGVGFEGLIVDLRQGADGEIKSIFLAECRRFLYEFKAGKPSGWFSSGKAAAFAVHDEGDGEVEGGVALDASAIRHVVLLHLDEQDADDVLDEGEGLEPGPNGSKQKIA